MMRETVEQRANQPLRAGGSPFINRRAVKMDRIRGLALVND